MDASCACETCGKHFSTANAYNNHLKSKKHRETAAKQTADVQQMNAKNKGKTEAASHSSNELRCDVKVTSSSGDMEAGGGVSEKDFGTVSLFPHLFHLYRQTVFKQFIFWIVFQ